MCWEGCFLVCQGGIVRCRSVGWRGGESREGERVRQDGVGWGKTGALEETAGVQEVGGRGVVAGG